MTFSLSDRINVHRIIETIEKPDNRFCDYKLQSVETKETLDEMYGEEKLELLSKQEIEKRSEGERGSSEPIDDWNTRALVGGMSHSQRRASSSARLYASESVSTATDLSLSIRRQQHLPHRRRP